MEKHALRPSRARTRKDTTYSTSWSRTNSKTGYSTSDDLTGKIRAVSFPILPSPADLDIPESAPREAMLGLGMLRGSGALSRVEGRPVTGPSGFLGIAGTASLRP